MKVHAAAIKTLLSSLFDFEHWLDARRSFEPVRELDLEHIWPLAAAVAQAGRRRSTSLSRVDPMSLYSTRTAAARCTHSGE